MHLTVFFFHAVLDIIFRIARILQYVETADLSKLEIENVCVMILR